MAQTTKALNQQMVQGQQAVLKMLEEQKKLATDDAQRAEIDKQIAEMKKSAAEATAEDDPAKDFNAGLIARYKADFDKLQSEDQRIAQEMQKGSNSKAAGRAVASSGERWARGLVCSRTGVTAPLDEPAFLSPAGAPWLVDYDLDARQGRRAAAGAAAASVDALALPRAAAGLGLRRPGGPGRGGTPLIRLRRFAPEGIELWVKDESGNPTGSFKARGLSLAVNRARELGAPGVQLASAGNAALALTAYAAAAGLPARVALPADTPRTIFERCAEYGAEVLSGPGTLVEAAKLLEEGKERYWSISTLREPYRVEGKKTMGLELAEQFGWELPDWIVYPLGGGTGIVGMHKAFDELERLDLIGSKRPRFVVVQAAGCAPIVRAWETGQEAAEPWENPRTRVWGLRVPRAHRRLPGAQGGARDGRRAPRGGRGAARRHHRLDRRARRAAGRARGRRRAGRGGGSGDRRRLLAGRAGGGLPDRRSGQLRLKGPAGGEGVPRRVGARRRRLRRRGAVWHGEEVRGRERRAGPARACRRSFRPASTTRR